MHMHFHKNWFARWFSLVLIIFTIISLSITLTGCRLLRRDKSEIAEKKQAKSDQKAMEAYEKAKKQHFNNQSKETQKMMKSTKKRSSDLNKSKKRSRLNKTKCP